MLISRYNQYSGGRLIRRAAPAGFAGIGFCVMGKQTKNADAVAAVQLLVNSRAHGACEALVDASLGRLLAGKQAVSMASLASLVAADIAKHTGVNVSAKRLDADLAYTLGINPQPGKACRTGAATVKAGKLATYAARSTRSPAAIAAAALDNGSKPATAKPAAKRSSKPKAAAAKPTDDRIADNG
jgi:hypothetical protein